MDEQGKLNKLKSLFNNAKDKNNLEYLSQWALQVHENEGCFKVILHRQRWYYLLTISLNELEFTMSQAPSIEKALDEFNEEYCQPDIWGYQGIGWCDPWDWLLHLGITFDDFEEIDFILGTTYGCYFSKDNQLVFVNRDHPKDGIALLKGNQISEVESHPLAHLDTKEYGSLFLKVARNFVEQEQSVKYKVSIFRTRHRIDTMKKLKSLMNIELSEAKSMTDGLSPVAHKHNMESALLLKKQLENIGAEVVISEIV